MNKTVWEDNRTIQLSEYRKGNGNNSGGGDMSQYVTREELKNVVKDLSHQMELNQTTVLSKFEILENKLDSIEESVTDKVQLAINEKALEDQKQSIETRRYIFGTIILGVIGIIISLFT